MKKPSIAARANLNFVPPGKKKAGTSFVHPVAFSVDDTMRRKLNIIANKRGIKLVVLMREITSEYLEQHSAECDLTQIES